MFVARSHGWLYEKLFEGTPPVEDRAHVTLDRESADVILYLKPPWSDPHAPDCNLRSFSPRELGCLVVYSQDDFPIPWAPGLYASLPRRRQGPLLRGGFYVPHHHREEGGVGSDLEAAQLLDPEFLWSFVGTGENHPSRQAILDLADPRSLTRDTRRFNEVVRWNWAGEHLAEGRDAFRTYGESIGRSKFILCPRGRGAGSIRLFEVMQAARAPVVISDDWSPPPFVEWEKCSIQIPERRIADIPSILREREGDAPRLGQEARRAWERWFSPQTQLSTLLAACAEIHSHSSRRVRFGIAAQATVSREVARQTARRGAGALRRAVPRRVSKR